MEFTGLKKKTDIISIGIISDTKETLFYAELNDYDDENLDKWIVNNVIKNLLLNRKASVNKIKDMRYVIKGSFDEVSYKLNKFLEGLVDTLPKNEKIQFVSDVCHYDFVLLVDLITDKQSALNLPDYISPTCYDINQLIAKEMNISLSDAFDLNREELLNSNISDFSNLKHNSLYDAKVIRLLYRKFNKRGGHKNA